MAGTATLPKHELAAEDDVAPGEQVRCLYLRIFSPCVNLFVTG